MNEQALMALLSGRGLPNTPRDPDRERRNRPDLQSRPFEPGNMSRIPPSQNPFLDPLPSEEEMQATAGVYAEPAPIIEEPAQPAAPSRRPGSEEPQKPATDNTVAYPTRDRDALRDFIQTSYAPNNEALRVERDGQSRQNALAVQEDNSKLGLISLFLDGANRAGTIGGKVASNAPFEKYAGQLSEQALKALDISEKSRKDIEQREDDRLKGYQSLANLEQQSEIAQIRDRTANTIAKNEAEGRNALLEVTSGKNAASQQFDLKKLELMLKQADTQSAVAQSQIGLNNTRAAQLAKGKSDKPLSELDLARIDEIKARTERIKKGKDPAGDKPITAAAAELDIFRKRMEEANTSYETLLKNNPSYDPTNLKDRAASHTPFGLGQYIRSDKAQLAEQYEIQFVRAKLRDESGAAIGKDEALKEADAYFPRAGDSAQTIASKAQARRTTIQAMKDSYNAQTGRGAESQGGVELPKNQVKVMWKGKPKLIPAERLDEALKLGATKI